MLTVTNWSIMLRVITLNGVVFSVVMSSSRVPRWKTGGGKAKILCLSLKAQNASFQ
jgi:hypothetical protein